MLNKLNVGAIEIYDKILSKKPSTIGMDETYLCWWHIMNDDFVVIIWRILEWVIQGGVDN